VIFISIINGNIAKAKADAGKNPKTDLGKLFGVSAAENNKETDKSPTRLIVRDAHLTKESKIRLENAPNTDMPMTEVKTEVNIDRITAAANPRQFERVPAGAVFQFEFILTLLEGDNTDTFLNLVHEGIALMQDDSLGGHGSRGYGQVTFTIEATLQRTAENYRKGEPAGVFPVAEAELDPQTA
jgi:CRISPR-associated protein Csm3